MTGKNTVREISKKTKVATGSISKIWSQWEEIGLVIKEGQKYKKVF